MTQLPSKPPRSGRGMRHARTAAPTIVDPGPLQPSALICSAEGGYARPDVQR
jgi:hypothetical protein